MKSGELHVGLVPVDSLREDALPEATPGEIARAARFQSGMLHRADPGRGGARLASFLDALPEATPGEIPRARFQSGMLQRRYLRGDGARLASFLDALAVDL